MTEPDIAKAFLIFFLLFVGTFVCGYLPSFIKAPYKVMNKIAIFGGGTIIGATLIVILPEACGILINAQNKLDVLQGKHVTEVVSHDIATTIGVAMMIGFSLMLFVDELFKILKER